ncbi:hypothetical protein UFOVP434_18 [uncultured Caudovirales phage]|uniref:Uncharacterized protein n=1 Tax=uncultured Caudovirales phage TaxID=2100421 RepID=A0A6J5MBZ7_9CAUD|nr:hypothetical protein UFOVP434_18 [uncultured Caudovirales phage]
MSEIILPESEIEWQSSGLLQKPAGCQYCSMYTLGKNFVPDYFPPKAKILFVFAAPEKDDILENRPLAGNLGWYRKMKLLDPLGLKSYEYAATNIIRCYPGKDKFNKLAYPAKSIRVKCEKLCRQYDNRSGLAGNIVDHGIINFDPNVFVITFGLEMLNAEPAYRHLMLADIRKALATIPHGGRPAVLFGEPAINLFAPYCFGPGQGGVKTWRGHIFEGSWKDLSVKDDDVKDMAKQENPFRRFGQKTKAKPLSGGLRKFIKAKDKK